MDSKELKEFSEKQTETKQKNTFMKVLRKIISVVLKIFLCLLCLFAIALVIEIFGPSDEKESEKSSVDQKETISKSEIINNCIEVEYKELLRYPEKYEGKYIIVTLYINQKLSSSWSNEISYFGYTQVSENWMNFDERYSFSDKRETDDMKILEKDIVKIYGVFTGLNTYRAVITNLKDEIPCIDAYYIDLIK